MTRTRATALAVFVVLAVIPFLEVPLPGLFDRPLNRPGTLQLLALCLTFAGVALSYNLLFGYTGLLSFGHALYFATGVYVADIAISRWHWSLGAAIALTAAAGVVLPLVLGAVSLRVGGIAFAMVTLAFAQAGSILVYKNPGGLTGGEEGLGLSAAGLPDFLVGVANTPYLYWIALAYLAVTFAAGWWAIGSRPGRVWQAIRENERRVEVMGFWPYAFKVLVFTFSGFLATAGGFVYLLLVGGASPEVTTANLSLALLLMVVLGGAGTLWGPALGGAVYEYLDYRLVKLSSSSAIGGLPGPLRAPLSEPLFVLGVLFILLVLFFPGGIAGVAGRLRRRRLGRAALPPTTVDAGDPVQA
ncbi:MAG TPA: branched-chain amino acid ABC transporter permease [Candidatus Dormibacteraeota bacterium]